jgi:hypothetical protein
MGVVIETCHMYNISRGSPLNGDDWRVIYNTGTGPGKHPDTRIKHKADGFGFGQRQRTGACYCTPMHAREPCAPALILWGTGRDLRAPV